MSRADQGNGWVERPVRPKRPKRAVMALLSLALGGWVLHRLSELAWLDSYRAVAIAWAGSILFFYLAVAAPRRPGAPRIQFQWKSWINRNSILLTLIVLAGAWLRLWRLGSIPFTLGGDEANFGMEALKVLEGKLRNPFATAWMSQPSMGMFFNSLSIYFTGATIAGVRLPWALVGAATVGVAYGVAARLGGRRVGLMTAALLATYHFHIHFSRLGINNAADPLLVGLALYFLLHALDGERPMDWALAGGLCGLAIYFYQGARFAPILAAAVILQRHIICRRGFGLARLAGPGLMLAAFLIVAGPMLHFAWHHPDDFNARINQAGVIQSGWLARETGIRHESAARIMFDQFRRAALAFNYYPDRTVWYGLPGPLLGPVSGAIFLLGLGLATFGGLARRGGARLFPMAAWWWGVTLLGGMLTDNPPSTQRLISLALPVCFLIALALDRGARLARLAWPRFPRRAFLAGAVLLFAVLSGRTYFTDHVPTRRYGGPHAEIVTEVAPLLAKLGPAYRMVLFGAPAMFHDFPTFAYLLPGIEGRDQIEPLRAAPPADWLPPGRGGVFIFLPARAGELAWVQKTFPRGEKRELFRPADHAPIATLYIVSP